MDWDDIHMVRIHARAAERRIEELEQEILTLRTVGQSWALYAFNRHGDDARLYNGLADLGGISADGEGWIKRKSQ